ncbi:Cytochrome b5 [Platanthera zijinensis]|uniref:Cytochrome b5 n=1 Tax=Platanthera zijinensis TaxID=2320716 RepID=A0AAP0BMS4_9ASPA
MEMIYMALFLAALLGALFIFRIPSARGKENKDFNTFPKERLRTSYSMDEVCLHNKRDDCWIIVKNKVYDVTPYVEEHPGGDAILNHAGNDSTEGFYGPQHASRVFDMIDEFYVGDLKP